MGVEPTSPPNSLWENRNPGQGDYAEYNIGDFWLVRNTNRIYVLIDKKYFIATWFLLGGGGGAGLLTLTGNSGGPIPGDMALNINTFGGGILTNVGAGNTLTMGFTASNNGQIIIGLTGFQPVWGNLTSLDGSLTVTGGAGTLDVKLTNKPIYSITVGASDLFPAVNGEVTFVSPDNSVLFAVVGNTLQITAPGGGGGGGTVTEVLGSLNIIVAPATPNPTVTLKSSIQLPVTNNTGTTGVIALGTDVLPGGYVTDRFLHAGGSITNTFIGQQSGNLTNDGTDNVGLGGVSLNALVGDGMTQGIQNTALGSGSLGFITLGSYNTAIGAESGFNLTLNDSSNILIKNAGSPGLNNTIIIGTQGAGAGQQNRFFAAGIYPVFPPTNTPRVVTINTANQFQTVSDGTPGYVLTLSGGGIPEWSNPSAGGTVTSVTAGVNLNNRAGVTTPNPIIDMNTSIQQPATSADGTQGVYALGGAPIPPYNYITNSFMHGYGTRNSFLGNVAGPIGVLTGTDLTGIGWKSLATAGSGNFNTAVGSQSLDRLTTTGHDNTAIGFKAGHNYLSVESSNISIGSNTIGTTGENNTLRISQSGSGAGQLDQAFIGGIYPNPASGTYRVTTTNSADQLQTIAPTTNGYVLTLDSGNPVWAAPGGGSGGSIVTYFPNSGSFFWSKNVNTKLVILIGWNGGGGGGGGSGAGPGGGGGFGGAYYMQIPSFFFLSTEPVVIGAGGVGGSSPGTGRGGDGGYTTVGDLGVPNGTGLSYNVAGTSGGASYNFGGPVGGFGSLVMANASINGSQVGRGGFNTGQAGGIAGTYGQFGLAMMAAAGGGAGGQGGTSGGSGGSIVSSVGLINPTIGFTTILAGGAGGTSGNPGSAGISSILTPAAPNATALEGFICGGSGGGGGGQGANGGQGGFPSAGGGGGGGGGGLTNGGSGGNGYLIIIEQM
jgi:hypothetical protein